jgi:hypothetical protein
LVWLFGETSAIFEQYGGADREADCNWALELAFCGQQAGRPGKQLEVETRDYLKDLFGRLPLLGEKPPLAELDRLLPGNWLKEHPEHVRMINQIRREEDKKSGY